MERPLNTILALGAALFFAACAAGPKASNAQPPAVASAAPVDAPAAPAAPPVPASADLAAAAKALDAEARRHVTERGLARDGYVHAMDVAALMLYAAQRGDAALYDQLMPYAQKLILQSPDDPYTTGFVLKRVKDGAKPEHSGAAETLWLARALWAGAGAFKADADRKLALVLLDAYARHAYTLQDVWLVRRHFDFATRSFAGLSVLPAYHGDFFAQARRSVKSAEWATFSDRSYKLVEHAATPSGLLLPLIYPEVGATYPGTGLELYAPNNVASLEDSCLGAEGAAGTLSRLGAGVLAFATAKSRGGLRAFYSIEDGAAAGSLPLSPAGQACLTRLAVSLGDGAALAALDPGLTGAMKALMRNRAQLPAAGPLLLAAQARGAL